jgi:hypothetical protein
MWSRHDKTMSPIPVPICDPYHHMKLLHCGKQSAPGLRATRASTDQKYP